MLTVSKCHLCQETGVSVSVVLSKYAKGERWTEIRPVCIDCLVFTKQETFSDEEGDSE